MLTQPEKKQFLSFISNKMKKVNGRNGSLMQNEDYFGPDAVKPQNNKSDIFGGSKKMTEAQQLKLQIAEMNIQMDEIREENK